MCKEWPSEERIDMIGHNGGEGLHYLDVKKQMLSTPQDWEVVAWLNEHSHELNWVKEEGKLEFEELAVFNKYLWNAAQEMMIISGWRPTK